jgi:hypothetical protein
MIEVYECEAECVHRKTANLTFNCSEVVEECKCKSPITMDMSTQLFYKSPDMELYNLMSVDTSGYKLGQSLLDQDLIMMPGAQAAEAKPTAPSAAPIMMPK